MENIASGNPVDVSIKKKGDYSYVELYDLGALGRLMVFERSEFRKTFTRDLPVVAYIDEKSTRALAEEFLKTGMQPTEENLRAYLSDVYDRLTFIASSVVKESPQLVGNDVDYSYKRIEDAEHFLRELVPDIMWHIDRIKAEATKKTKGPKP